MTKENDSSHEANLPADKAGNSQILLYETDEGSSKIEVKLENETVWLTQDQMADLFDKARSTITEHINNVFKEGELEETSVRRDFRRTGSDGKEYNVKYYNLDVIISVGYRVKSHRGTQFRIWATKQLKEYIIKGFVMNDERLEADAGTERARYFDELLERVRKIRSSEQNLYQKVRDIFATSIDYNPQIEHAKDFFATVQNKFHFAITGNTAAELIVERVDADKPNMGLTNWKGGAVKTEDAKIAKNYMIEKELRQLYLIVEQFLAFAELQIERERPMYMKDWKGKLDDFLKLNEMEILQGTGKVSKKDMEKVVKAEMKKFRDNAELLGKDTTKLN
jgi:hypothetical protein